MAVDLPMIAPIANQVLTPVSANGRGVPAVFQTIRTIRTSPLGGDSLLSRSVRAISLDRTLFEEVGNDKHAMPQAIILLMVVAIATGIGTLDNGNIGDVGPASTLVIIGWFVWSSLVFLVSRKFRGFAPRPTEGVTTSRADWSSIARVMAFAQAPGLLRIFGLVSGLGLVAAMAALLWQFAAMTVGLRAVMRYESHRRALALLAIAFTPYLIIVGSISFLMVTT